MKDDSASYKKIDYRVRPAKNIERKMFSESFQRLSFFNPIEDYRYIGFGSTTFTDFILFHNFLNITDMISIEKRAEDAERFELNKPFKCIKIMYGKSNDILPRLTWDECTITWLDYDHKLNKTALQDIAFISSQAISGNIIIVTVSLKSIKGRNRNERFENFTKSVGEINAPVNLEGKDIEDDLLPFTIKQIIENQIKTKLKDINGIKTHNNIINYKSLYNFVYNDGTRM
jgi:hypothetical protein